MASSFMRRLALVCASVLVPALASGCAATQKAQTSPGAGAAKLAYAAEEAPPRPASAFFAPGALGGLSGRSVTVNSVSDLRLRPREIALTFDDGPLPGRTEKVLDALDAAGVKATFLMVGQMARSYPALVRKVAARGHSIGTHTQNHANLAHLSLSGAEAQIDAGIRSVSDALVPSLHRPAPFFRFPYLASTPALRRQLAARGIVVIDADIDSKDYFQSTPEQVRKRTLARIEARGSGIVLMHDIHGRTAAMLPGLLRDLRARGYHVVRLAPGRGGVLTASLTR